MAFTLSRVKEKLSSSRELCSGLTEEMYALADYMAESMIANGSFCAYDLAAYFIKVLRDVEKGKSSFKYSFSELPQFLIEHKDEVLRQADSFSKIIAAISFEEYVGEFREVYEAFKMKSIKLINAKLEGDYPEYVKAAVEWWTKAVLARSIQLVDMPENVFNRAFALDRNYSEEEISTFKRSLAEGIIEELENNYHCELQVDYSPKGILAVAGAEIGIHPLSVLYFPRAYMEIRNDKVSIVAGYDLSYHETIWSR